MTPPRSSCSSALFGLNAAVLPAPSRCRGRLAERSLASRVETLRAEVERERRVVASLKDRADDRERQRPGHRSLLPRRREEPEGGSAPDDPVPREERRRSSGSRSGVGATAPQEVKGLGPRAFRHHDADVGALQADRRLPRPPRASARFLIVDQIQLRERSDVGARPDLRALGLLQGRSRAANGAVGRSAASPISS